MHERQREEGWADIGDKIELSMYSLGLNKNLV